jgi:hypothetical protein
MSKPITYSPLPDPGGLTQAEWAREIRILRARGWLQDPDSFAWPDDPKHPCNVERRQQEGACFQVCWRGKCKRARRCVHLAHLAIRENRHKIWPKTWKESVARGSVDEEPVLVPARRLPRLRTDGRRNSDDVE